MSLVAFALAVAGAVAPGRLGQLAGWALLAVLVVAPAARVGFLAFRWWRIGDLRYAVAALGVVAILVAAPLAVIR